MVTATAAAGGSAASATELAQQKVDKSEGAPNSGAVAGDASSEKKVDNDNQSARKLQL
jgi:hypothetical protein